MRSAKELFVIDANGFLHRNYHALPKLSTSKGEEVGALYGFVNWLIRFVKEKRPRYVAVCFDSKGPTFRHNLYKEYKANRPPADEALVSQLKTAREVVAALGFKVLAEAGAEADDLMASATACARKAGANVVLITSDKDIYQLLGAGMSVSMWSGAAKEKYKNNESCRAKFGVACKFMTDYLAMVGDSSDNVPGIAGIGSRTAAELIANFGGLEKILEAAAAGTPAMKPITAQKVLAGQSAALLSKQLVLLKDDLLPEADFEDFKLFPPDGAKTAELIKRFEFKNLLGFLEEYGAPPPAAALPAVQGDLFAGLDGDTDAEADCTMPADDALAACEKSKEIFIYAEDDFCALAASPDCCCVFEIEKITQERQERLFALIADDSILKIGHDIKYTLRTLGFESRPPAFLNCFDAALAKYCLDPSGEFSLGGALAVNMNIMVSPAEPARKRLPLYARHIWELRAVLLRLLKENGQQEVFADMEMPLMSVLLNMETNGIMVDSTWLKTLDILFAKEMAAEQKEVNELAGGEVNINSPKQLGVLLYEQLKLPAVKKTKTGYSTDEEALSRLKNLHPVAEHILKYRESAKLKSTYVDALLNLAGPARRVHTNFNQTGTVTGRLSSFSPNLQNIPIRTEKGRLIRQAFAAPEDRVLLSADYSQIDLRVLAHESGDENLINAFRNNADIHTQTAAEVFGIMPELVTKEQRMRAKTINFGIVYGQGPVALAQMLNISAREAKEYIDAYFARYSAVKKWLDEAAAQARKAGYVKTLFGHVRYMPEFEAPSARIASFANRASVNTIVQGGSSDIIKKAMLDIYKEMPSGVLMLLQVHDELVFEIPRGTIKETALWVKEKMENAVRLKVPLLAEAKAGKNWNEMGKVV
ncbi:MAG: DNA polymerase I [Elusimicrobiota bacterium]|jgi:DNA polymerase-1|nr:DNA polymerase I [Elusimicrobiota bacterium]